jgi:hypothetical protein
MNPRFPLHLSLGLNLLLAGTIVWALKFREGSPERPSAAAAITNRVVRVRMVTNQTAPATVEVAAAFHWREVESADYRVYIENLRNLGCPEETIRDIVVADVSELFRRRVQAIVDEVSPHFWELVIDSKQLEKVAEQKRDEVRTLEEERTGMLRALFGIDDPAGLSREEESKAENADEVRRTLEFLSDEKFAGIQAIQEHSRTAREELKAASGLARAGRDARNKEIAAEEERRLQALLAPAELDEYKLRTGPAAALRDQLADLDVTENELRVIARARTDTNHAGEIEEVLGPERFADYGRAIDNRYHETLRITDRFDLPTDTAREVYRMRVEAEAEVWRVRRDPNRAPEEREAILRAMRAETEKSISAVLGPGVFKTYQEYSGDWLSRFADESK